MNNIEVYTDGSATTSDKPGGYAWVIVVDGKFHSEGSGSIPNATNNDSELEAAIVGLANAYKAVFTPIDILGRYEAVEIWPPTVTLVSDSEIVLGWLTGKYRFKQTAKYKKYETLIRLKDMMNVQARWVEGHAGNEWNERCDKLAGIERRKAMGIEPKKRSNKSKILQTYFENSAANVEAILKTTQEPYTKELALAVMMKYKEIKEQLK